MDTISQYLQRYGIRPSVQRLAIMNYLLQNRTHPTADDVFEALKRNIPTLSKTTVYNTLKLFVDHGAAICVGIDEKNVRFDAFTEPHAHFRCKKCGKIIDLHVNPRLFGMLPDHFKGEVEESHFYLKGLCENCKLKSN